ncbi:MAG TPA: hypothetical protein VIK35_10985 [Verrucomicrobiae bacterium]
MELNKPFQSFHERLVRHIVKGRRNTTRTVNGKAESLVFPTNAFVHSVHASLNCVDSHTDVKDLVHDPLGPPDCMATRLAH